MYSVTAQSKAAWRRIFQWVSSRAGVQANFVEHEPPRLLSELWARDDLGLVMMCGLPFALRTPHPTILAVPVPSIPRYRGQAVYRTDIAVRADASYPTLRDTFGGRCGYTLKDSHSGYVAFRHHLMTRYPDVAEPYSEIVGHLLNPRGVIEALIDGRIDVGPLDSYCYDLIRDGDPALAAQVRIVESTDEAPMPAIVATAPVSESVVASLRAAFEAVADEPSLAAERRALSLARFTVPDGDVYRVQRQWAGSIERDAPAWN